MQESVFIFFTTKALLFREITGFFEHKTYVRFFESVCTYCFFVAVLKGKLHFSVLRNPCFDRHALCSCRAVSRTITKTPAHISKFCQKKPYQKRYGSIRCVEYRKLRRRSMYLFSEQKEIYKLSNAALRRAQGAVHRSFPARE
mgnify:CR=1 FL=1